MKLTISNNACLTNKYYKQTNGSTNDGSFAWHPETGLLSIGSDKCMELHKTGNLNQCLEGSRLPKG